MKLKIERANLLAALSHVQNAVERRNTIPILSNVLLSGEENGLCLTATDLDLSIVENTAADIITLGATTTPAHLLYDIVRKLPDGAQIEMSMDSRKGQLSLKSGRSNFSLPCLPREDYPVIATQELSHSFKISASDLRHLVDKTRFAMSSEETRYYLNGIYIHATELSGKPTLRAVATDGHRLALLDSPLPEGAERVPSVIVPRKAIGELRRLLEHTEKDVDVNLSDSQIRFTVASTVLTTKLIDGTFPDYQRVIPEKNDKFLEVVCSQFASAVDRVSTISTEKSRAIKLTLEKDGLQVSATNQDTGSASEELVVSYSGDAIEIGFNSRYLLEIAQQIEGENAHFNFADSVSPAIIRDPGDEHSLYVLMPMRV